VNNPLTKEQKMLLHIYADAAALTDLEYRRILRERAHVASAADPRFSQVSFERVMASLETELAGRVSSGRVMPPRSRYIRSLDYWRRKCPRQGLISIRQRYAIESAWGMLVDRLPAGAGTNDYLLGMIVQACGRRAAPGQLDAKEAERVIDALKSRLAQAVRKEVAHVSP
jgi:hypothetical protein